VAEEKLAYWVEAADLHAAVEGTVHFVPVGDPLGSTSLVAQVQLAVEEENSWAGVDR
jgi:hypothetical protein